MIKVLMYIGTIITIIMNILFVVMIVTGHTIPVHMIICIVMYNIFYIHNMYDYFKH